MKESNHDNDEEPILRAERDLHHFRILDPSIASVIVDTNDNNLDDGYNIFVSASFGKETIHLKADSEKIDVEMSVNKSIIELRFLNSSCRFIADNEDALDSDVTESANVENNRASENCVSGSAEFASDHPTHFSSRHAVSARGSVNVGRQANASALYARRRKKWRLITKKSLFIDGDGDILANIELDRYRGWRVTPTTRSDTSGVIALLKVREEWVNFDNIRYPNFKDAFSGRVKELYTSRRKRKRILWEALVKFLALKQIETEKFDYELVIAADALVVKPDADRIAEIGIQRRDGALNLPLSDLQRFLEAPSGTEVQVLLDIGMPEDRIPQVPDEADNVLADFTPRNDPISIINVLKSLQHEDAPKPSTTFYSIHTFKKNFGENALKDLNDFALVRLDGNFINTQLQKNNDDTLEEVLIGAALNIPRLRVATRLLQSNPNFDAVRLLLAVSEEINFEKEEGRSKEEVEILLLEWARFLQP